MTGIRVCSPTRYWVTVHVSGVSSLSLLSKILEKIVVSQLNSHIISSHISNHYQSAYWKFYSTATALLKIHNDILSSMDGCKVTTLTLPDVSAAFHAIDHTIVLRRPDYWFGVSGKALDWFKSYLTGGSQRIKLLGPLIITLYTPPHSSLLSLIISMLMIASCIFPFHRATLLQH